MYSKAETTFEHAELMKGPDDFYARLHGVQTTTGAFLVEVQRTLVCKRQTTGKKKSTPSAV